MQQIFNPMYASLVPASPPHFSWGEGWGMRQFACQTDGHMHCFQPMTDVPEYRGSDKWCMRLYRFNYDLKI